MSSRLRTGRVWTGSRSFVAGSKRVVRARKSWRNEHRQALRFQHDERRSAWTPPIVFENLQSSLHDAKRLRAELSRYDCIDCDALVVGGGLTGYATAFALVQQGYKHVHVLDQGCDHTDGTIRLSKVDRTALYALKSLGIDLSYLSDDLNGEGPIQRHILLSDLQRYVEQHLADRITVTFGARVEAVCWPQPDDTEEPILVVSRHVEEHARVWSPSLLVAADGFRSTVAASLREQFSGEGFEICRRPSDSAGLAFKTLTLHGDVAAQLGYGTDADDDHVLGAVIPTHAMMQLRVSKVPNMTDGVARAAASGAPSGEVEGKWRATFIMWPHHPFWRIQEPAKFHEFMEDSFPDSPFKSLTTDQDIRDFLDSPISTFPCPQYCARMARAWPREDAAAETSNGAASSFAATGSSRSSSVVLVGASAHNFPPDLDQALIPSLADVIALKSSLEEHGRDHIGAALTAYERARVPENQALARLMQIGMPYRYRQEGTRIRAAIWKFNLELRKMLSRVAPRWFAPPAAVLVKMSQEGLKDSTQRLTTSYAEILQRVQTTTKRLWLMLSAFTLAVVMKLGRFAW